MSILERIQELLDVDYGEGIIFNPIYNEHRYHVNFELTEKMKTEKTIYESLINSFQHFIDRNNDVLLQMCGTIKNEVISINYNGIDQPQIWQSHSLKFRDVIYKLFLNEGEFGYLLNTYDINDKVYLIKKPTYYIDKTINYNKEEINEYTIKEIDFNNKCLCCIDKNKNTIYLSNEIYIEDYEIFFDYKKATKYLYEHKSKIKNEIEEHMNKLKLIYIDIAS